MPSLLSRINIHSTSSSPPGLIEANTVDPFSKAGKYALAWQYFCIILLVLVSITRVYHMWTDKLRQALYKEHVENNPAGRQPVEHRMGSAHPHDNTKTCFSSYHEKTEPPTYQSSASSVGIINDTLALFRWIFYRPIPAIVLRKKEVIVFPSLAVTCLLLMSLALITLYCFLPQPYYWESIRYGSPPLAIRAGMTAISLVPWIIATSMKANLISIMTGIGHDRLNVLHRWGGWLCSFMALVHVVPFYVQPVWEDGGLTVFTSLISVNGVVYGTGICVLVPLSFLCLGSLPFVRARFYELFVVVHVPVAFVFLGMLFWHCQNTLNSWAFLYTTCVIWTLSYLMRIFNLNWAKPWRMSWLIGDEAAVTIMAENAVKITIPTQMRWRPGQFVYLRIPGISLLDNHPFTISSLCSDDFPSDYGHLHRDCTLVFRPFGGFTRRVLKTAIDRGPLKTYRAYLDGPYGGMQRELAAFETVVLIAGGSGITAIVSHLLNLIKRMRDGKAVTTKVEVIWSLKQLEVMDWFREELRICLEHAPPGTVTCQFFVTAAKRQMQVAERHRARRPISTGLRDRLDGFVAGIAEKRHSVLIHEEAKGDVVKEGVLRAEDQNAITALPQQKYLQHTRPVAAQQCIEDEFNRLAIARRESLRLLEGRDAGKTLNIDREGYPQVPRQARPSMVQSSLHFPPPPTRPHTPESRLMTALRRLTTGGADTKPGSQTIQHSEKGRAEAMPPHHTHPAPTHARSRTSTRYTGDLRLTIPQTLSPSFISRSGAQSPPPISIPPQVAAPSKAQTTTTAQAFDFGFPTTPTALQKSLMRFAFLPTFRSPAQHSAGIGLPGSGRGSGGWSTQYGRPDLGYMLREMATGGPDGRGILGRRTCVFICGPAGMRVDVARTVAGLQADIWGDSSKSEIFLHTENYAI